jgi:hypothetical protein
MNAAFVPLAICVNPMSGRDVRRLAARASNMTHETKRDIVARVAAGAEAMGVTDIFVTREPFRIASLALQHMGLRARVHVLELPIHNSALDTEQAVAAFLEAGCSTLVSIGGDGTNRAIVRALHAAQRCADVHLVPLSTGTNNVFPVLEEPTVAGMVAGLQASGQVRNPQLSQRCKVLHVHEAAHDQRDLGLIDAVLLRDDFIGNLLPFAAEKIRRLLLTRAEPNAVGMSPIGGMIDVVDAADDAALLVEMGSGSGDAQFLAPLAPGAFQTVSVHDASRIPLDTPVIFRGPGILALDGDREVRLSARGASITVQRDGPWVLDIAATMRWVVGQGIIAPSLAGHHSL